MSLVGRVRNLTPNYVSPQYHLISDNLFQTIFNNKPVAETTAAAIFDNIFDTARDWYGEEDFDGKGKIIYHPPDLEDVWLSEEERCKKKLGVWLRKEADRARKDALEQRIVEDIRQLHNFSDDADGHVPQLIPADSDSDLDEYPSDDESVIIGGGNIGQPLAPEGAHIITPEEDTLTPPAPPAPPAPNPASTNETNAGDSSGNAPPPLQP